MKIQAILSFLLAATIQQAVAQQPLYMPLNIKQAYEKGTRNESGAPGAKYWQNHADYNIQVSFAPETNRVAGAETIIYTNNSQDTLREINFKLFPNLYQKGNIHGMPISPDDLSDGVVIKNFRANGTEILLTKSLGTNMPVQVPALAPGKQLKLELDFSYILNENTHIRTGSIDTGAYFIAYFFPRIAVYDDINGWDRIPYTGITEFYNDFCDFHVAITAPGDYAAWATGDLVNGHEVYQPKILQKIAQAEKNDKIMFVIDSVDVKEHKITKSPSSNTWRFEAKNVMDFAFALSNHYLWQASSVEVDARTKRRTRVDAVFNPEHADYFEVAGFARATVKHMSYTFPRWPYPYSHETVFDGLDQMEYPMMVNDNPLNNKAAAIELTDHEIFHTMFPFYMGVNETMYAWMDEGWATIGEWVISPMIDSTIVDDYGMQPYNTIAGKYQDLPIMTPSNQLSDAYMTNSYPKPGLGYLYIKDLLGDSLFLKALHHYITLWNGKHPQPYDFFNAMNAGAGRNLNWFWQSWFFDNGYPDQAIAAVKQDNEQCEVIVEAKGTKPVPVDVTVTFDDGSSRKFHRTVACWESGAKQVAVAFTSSRKIKQVILGDTWDADINRADNIYKAAN
ncbi:M1 family metallopeptidase [Chitinophaga sp. Hz27]|uniref:M1 family metallopeptidase n=1 Tax=Chitinophaga sp. Hz27 TaxID=3347169 RepID=UPI0035D599BF